MKKQVVVTEKQMKVTDIFFSERSQAKKAERVKEPLVVARIS